MSTLHLLMESGRSSQTEDQPPALPAKQHRHRSHSYRGSSVGSDSVLHSPDGLQTPSYTLNDVFPESTDCHAAQCPIHQDIDSVKHQLRFLSDGTPPPVPRKRLVRTLSLPANHVPPLSPLSPLSPRHMLKMHPQNFDNPLYMLAPIHDMHFNKEFAGFGSATGSGTAPPLPLSQLSFDTPDDRLFSFFSNFEDQGAVSENIQHRHLLFLRRMAHNIEAKLLMREEVSEKNISSYQPQDFLLDEASEPKRVAGTVYYSVHSPKFPGRTLGLRLCTQTDKPSSVYTRPRPLHVNVQNVVAHFQPTSNLKDSCLKTQTLDSSFVSNSGCAAAKTPCGGSNEYANYSGSSLVSTVQHLLWKGHSVSIERDLPLATLEDFVQESHSLQNFDCVLYDKQVCLLLLQILMGSQRLYNNSACAPELIPREILLVWPGIERSKQESSEVKSNQTKANNWFKVTEQEGADKKEHIQMLWETLGCPRVVITSQTSALPVPQSFVSIKTQIGALIQYCLNAREGQAAPYMPPYRKGLLHLAAQLHNSSSLNIKDMVTVLQVILWGPCVPLIHLRCIGTSTLHNWMTVKRALLVMKLAEKGLDHSGLDWEDFLGLQYLSFTDPETLIAVTSQFE